jgi:hypothetical protein
MDLNILPFTIFSIFMRIHLTLFCLLSSLNLSAFADTFKLPENKPIVSFVLPESCKATLLSPPGQGLIVTFLGFAGRPDKPKESLEKILGSISKI